MNLKAQNPLSPPLRLAGIGCRGRPRTYMSLASRFPDLYQIAEA